MYSNVTALQNKQKTNVSYVYIEVKPDSSAIVASSFNFYHHLTLFDVFVLIASPVYCHPFARLCMGALNHVSASFVSLGI